MDQRYDQLVSERNRLVGQLRRLLLERRSLVLVGETLSDPAASEREKQLASALLRAVRENIQLTARAGGDGAAASDETAPAALER